MDRYFYGHKRTDFIFKSRDAILVTPSGIKNGKWMLKTEYFGAFPELEIAMLERGYSLAYLKNRSRWGTDDDQVAKRDFAEYLHKEHGLCRRCICIGMSCGGFHAVNFASRYPSYISLLYLDAPLLSFRGWTGEGREHRDIWEKEQLEAYGFCNPCELEVYSDNPINRLNVLTDNMLPVALVYGDSDTCVDPDKNSRALLSYYQLKGAPIKVWCKPGCDHHPHVAVDTDEVIDFILQNEL